MSNVNWPEVLLETGSRMDFKGINFYLGYAEYPPYSIVNDTGNDRHISGLLVDTIREFGASVNLTVVMKEARPENVNVWGHK